VGGAPLLGLNSPVLKTHGSSKRLAFKNSILFANSFCEKRVCELIKDTIN
jgi:glycerol-3-phosphate acyltransferase PlsX